MWCGGERDGDGAGQGDAKKMSPASCALHLRRLPAAQFVAGARRAHESSTGSAVSSARRGLGLLKSYRVIGKRPSLGFG